MKRLAFLFVLALTLPTLAQMTARTDTGNGQWSNTSIWSPNGTPLSSDSVYINASRKDTNSTAAVCSSFVMNATGGYCAHPGASLKVGTLFDIRALNTGGVVHDSGYDTMSGSGYWRANNTAGTVDFKMTMLWLLGALDSIACPAANARTAAYIYCAPAGGKTVIVSSGIYGLAAGTCPVMEFGSGTLFAKALTYISALNNGKMWKNAGATFSGTGGFNLQQNGAGLKDTIPALYSADAFPVTITPITNTDTVVLGGNQSTQGAYTIDPVATTGMVFNANGFSLRAAGALTIGPSSTGALKTYLGTGRDTSGSFARGAGTGPDTVYPQTVQWVNKGNFNQGTNAKAATATGTSWTLRQENTANATITSNKQHFGRFVNAGATGIKTSFADIFDCEGDFIDTSGKVFTAGFLDTIGGDMYIYSPDTTHYSTSTVVMTKKNAKWKRQRPANSVGIMGGMTLNAPNGLYFDVDTNQTIYRDRKSVV